MSVEAVITGFPDYGNKSFLDDLRTTYGGHRVAQYEGGPVPLPADVDPTMIGREVPPLGSEAAATPDQGTQVAMLPEQRRMPTTVAAGLVAVNGARQ